MTDGTMATSRSRRPKLQEPGGAITGLYSVCIVFAMSQRSLFVRGFFYVKRGYHGRDSPTVIFPFTASEPIESFPMSSITELKARNMETLHSMNERKLKNATKINEH